MKDLFDRILRRPPRVQQGDLKYLDFDFGRYHFIRSTNYRFINSDNDDGDGLSISSVSTNATADNIPGTGRVIDKWIYQFFGRKIERLANQFSMSRLDPATIVQCLGDGTVQWFHVAPRSMRTCIKFIYMYSEHPGGGGVEVAGLKSLARQAQ